MVNTKFDIDVLIIGAGPNGLALATELIMRGHTVRLVEKNDRTGVQPRAKTTNVRTMTQMRRWGLAQKVRDLSPLDDDFPRDVIFNTGLLEQPIFSFKNAFNTNPTQEDEYPEHAEYIPQYVIEGILAEHVTAHPNATLSFAHEFLSFEQDEDGVTTQVANIATGEKQTIHSQWIVGADGGNSAVRRALDIEMRGQRNIVRFSTLILRIAGLNADPKLVPGLFHWILDADAAAILGPMDKNDIWFWAKVANSDTDVEELLEHVKTAIGKDYPIELITRDDWQVNSLLADKYRDGRAFLVGDACHLHSPFGGHGMNQGIGDSVDLGWKLSAALNGWATEGLLDSYFTERRQTHEAVNESSSKNVQSLSEHFANPDLTKQNSTGDQARAAAAIAIEQAKTPEFKSLGLVLGYRYSDSTAIDNSQPKAEPLNVSHYVPNAQAGHLAPHAWLADGSSLYDHFSLGFTLLRLADVDTAGESALIQAALHANVPLTTYQVDLETLYGAKYALIRPDQHVAWRGDKLPNPQTLISIMQGEG